MCHKKNVKLHQSTEEKHELLWLNKTKEWKSSCKIKKEDPTEIPFNT